MVRRPPLEFILFQNQCCSTQTEDLLITDFTIIFFYYLDDFDQLVEEADKGYLSKALQHQLWQRGLHLVTGSCRNIKNDLMPLLDKVLLRKRFIMETLFDKLKSTMGLEHRRLSF